MAEEGTISKSSTKTSDTLDQNSESDKEEQIPSTSKQINQDVNPSCAESNSELLKENTFLLPPVLACLFENSTPQALFNYRLVGQHIWNELAVNAINQDKSVGVRLVKIIDPNRTNVERIKDTVAFTEVPINTMISTLRAGGLKKSTLARIYLNSSLTNSDLKEYLELNGQNIRVLHYDGYSLKTLRKILQTSAKNLMSLSLWTYTLERESEQQNQTNEGLFQNSSDAQVPFKLPRLERLVIASGDVTSDRGTVLGGQIDYCKWKPSAEFLSDIFQASPNLKSLSARFSNSFIFDSGLSFEKLTTLCIKFELTIADFRTLCQVGLRLKKLRLQGLYVKFQYETDDAHLTDPEWMEFREILLQFIQAQAATLEYFGAYLFKRCWPGQGVQHNTQPEQWSTRAGFPGMPNLHTLMFDECSGRIPKIEFRNLFPKLRNLEIVACRSRYVVRPPQPNLAEYPLEIPNSLNQSTSVRNIRGIKPTMELAQMFPVVVEYHIENKIPHGLPIYWPKLKHLYYKESYENVHPTLDLVYIRRISKFLVGISPEESERIEEQRFGPDEFKKLQMPRSRPSVFDLNDLETFEFGFISKYVRPLYEIGYTNSAIKVLVNLGLLRLLRSTRLKKINFTIEAPEPGFCSVSSASRILIPSEPTMYKWHYEVNLDHHKSEWKEIDGLFHDDPDIWELGFIGYMVSAIGPLEDD